MKLIKKVFPWIFGAGVIFFLIGYLVRNWQEVSAQNFELNWGYLIPSLLLLLFLFFYQTVIWRYLLVSLGEKISISEAYRIFNISNLGRYIPGKVWQILGIMYLADKKKLSKSRVGTTIVFAIVLLIFAGFIVALPSVGQVNIGRVSLAYFWFAVPVILFFIFSPKSLVAVLNYILARFKRGKLQYYPSWKQNLLVLLLYISYWAIYGVSFYLFILSFGQNIRFADVVGVYPAASIVGYLALFVPSGLGIREGVVTALLSPYLPLPIATLIGLTSRLWFTAAEIISASVALLLGVKK